VAGLKASIAAVAVLVAGGSSILVGEARAGIVKHRIGGFDAPTSSTRRRT